MVCIEDLQVRNMSRSAAGSAEAPGKNVRAKSGLNKSILALEGGWTALLKGDFAKNAPGAPSDHSNVNYFYVQSEIRF